MSDAITYFNDHADDIFENYKDADRHFILKPLLHHMSLDKPYQVLDLGSGGGQDADYLVTSYDAKVTAVEPSYNMHIKAKQAYTHSNITWLNDKLPEISQVSDKFNVIILSAVWQYLDPEARLKSYKRICDLSTDECLIYLSYPIPASREYQHNICATNVEHMFDENFETLENDLIKDSRNRKALNGEDVYFQTFIFKKS